MPPKTQTRERVLSAAVRTLAEQGFAATTARAIATTGGFAPGVIYYHFDDLEDLLVATMRYASEQRIARYTERTATVGGFAELVGTLRELYTEDADAGHIAAVQEMVAGAKGSPKLAAQTLVEVERWEELAAAVLSRYVAGTPIEALVPLRELATVAIAYYMGIETLSHLDGDRHRPDAVFEAASRAAVMMDTFRNLSGS
jgi:AcrR family transcriptional regulator